MNNQNVLAQYIQLLRQELPVLRERHQVESLSVLGSFVRQERRPGSDWDILVIFRETPGLLKFLELENYLSDALGIKVDLVMKDAMKPHIGRRILSEAVTV